MSYAAKIFEHGFYIFRSIPADDVLKTKQFNTEEEKFDHVRDWLYERFVEKEKLLDYFYKYSNFPSRNDISDGFNLRFPKLNYWSVIITQFVAYCTFYVLVRLVLAIF